MENNFCDKIIECLSNEISEDKINKNLAKEIETLLNTLECINAIDSDTFMSGMIMLSPLIATFNLDKLDVNTVSYVYLDRLADLVIRATATNAGISIAEKGWDESNLVKAILGDIAIGFKSGAYFAPKILEIDNKQFKKNLTRILAYISMIKLSNNTKHMDLVSLFFNHIYANLNIKQSNAILLIKSTKNLIKEWFNKNIGKINSELETEFEKCNFLLSLLGISSIYKNALNNKVTIMFVDKIYKNIEKMMQQNNQQIQ